MSTVVNAPNASLKQLRRQHGVLARRLANLQTRQKTLQEVSTEADVQAFQLGKDSASIWLFEANRAAKARLEKPWWKSGRRLNADLENILYDFAAVTKERRGTTLASEGPGGRLYPRLMVTTVSEADTKKFAAGVREIALLAADLPVPAGRKTVDASAVAAVTHEALKHCEEPALAVWPNRYLKATPTYTFASQIRLNALVRERASLKGGLKKGLTEAQSGLSTTQELIAARTEALKDYVANNSDALSQRFVFKCEQPLETWPQTDAEDLDVLWRAGIDGSELLLSVQGLQTYALNESADPREWLQVVKTRSSDQSEIQAAGNALAFVERATRAVEAAQGL